MQQFKSTTVDNLTIYTAIFLTVVGNFRFFSEIVSVYTLDNIWFIFSLVVWLSCFLIILLLLVCYRYSVKPVLVVLLLASSIVSYFANNYSIPIDSNMIINILETDADEVLNLLNFKLALYFILLGVLPSYFVCRVKILNILWEQQLWKKIKIIATMVIIFTFTTLGFAKFYVLLATEHKELRLFINPTYYLYAISKVVGSKLEATHIEFKKIGEDAHIARQDNSRKLIIMVLGETARADRFSLNGYHKLTNVLLSKENVISLSEMYSCGTDTAASLPCIFSMLGRKNYSYIKNIKSTSNVLDILSYAGIKVLWRDNNSGSKGVADRVLFQNYKSSDVNKVCDIECRDEGMLTDLQGYIDTNQNEDIFIVLHTIGSHGPNYYKRYPQEFEIFTPVCVTNQLNKCTNEQINNAYDNSIIYTDYFLSKTIELLKNNQNNFKTAMFYISDHGESLGERGLYLHGMPYFLAPKEQIHVASVLWFSDNFAKDVDIGLLKKNANETLSHDGVFHTLLGLMDVNTKVYDKKLDFIPRVE